MDTDLSSPKPNDRALGGIVIVAAILFVTLGSLGYWGPDFMANDKCYALFGCNIGFFGYDAAVHFTSGIMNASLIIFLMRRFPALNLFHERFWKNFLIIISLVALIAVTWEIGELSHDQFRIKVLGENLTAPNRLDQPTNDDTMGDMTFSILGAALTAGALQSYISKKKTV